MSEQELQNVDIDDLTVIEEDASSIKLSPLLIEEYLAEIDVSKQSKKEYGKVLRKFFGYLEQMNIPQPTKRDLIAYKENLYTSYTARTITFTFSVLRNFFDWTEFHRIYPNISYGIKGVRISKNPKRQALTSSQVCQILNNIDRSTLQGAQKYALVLLTSSTGLRAAEVSALNVEDIVSIQNKRVLKIRGKGHIDKDQLIPIGALTDQAIRDLLAMRVNYKSDDPIFISASNRNYGARLRPEGVARLLKRILEENGFTGSMYTGHSFRHTACCLGLEVTGSDLVSVKGFMRHSNVETTLIYADHDSVLKKDIASAIEARLSLDMNSLHRDEAYYASAQNHV